VIPQAAREKSQRRHEGADFEADRDPLTFRGAIDSSCGGLWSTKCEEAFTFQLRDGHFEIVRGDREETVRTIAAATPDLFDEWMV
jgi:hypothetical protein